MKTASYFEQGLEHYQKREYNKAAELFTLSVVKDFSTAGHAWLGQCYEYGLGVEKDLMEAKDLYTTGFNKLTSSEKRSDLAKWLTQKLQALEGIPQSTGKSMFIEGTGNVKVTKIKSANRTQLRYNANGIIVSIHTSESFRTGFVYAQETIPQLNKEWNCDGASRFYDGYSLKTDFFTLNVKRGCAAHTDSGSYHTSIIKADAAHYICSLEFPANANLEYIYVQKTIMNKVLDMLYIIAQEILPEKLKEVSDKTGTAYKKCIVTRKGQGDYCALNYAHGKFIELRTTCIQLPAESLEALCVHELTHNFIDPHNKEFYDKMIELGNKLPIGGEAIYKLDRNRFEEGRWRYLQL